MCVCVCALVERRERKLSSHLSVVHQTQMFKVPSPQKHSHTRRTRPYACYKNHPTHPSNGPCLFLSFPSMHIGLSRSWRCIYHNAGPTRKTSCEKKKWLN